MRSAFSSRNSARPARRGSALAGQLALAAAVIVGLGAGHLAFRWQAARLAPELELGTEIETGDVGSAAARVRTWFERQGQAQIHHALVERRYRAERDWLLTHINQPPAEPGHSFAPELWGIDLTACPPERLARLEGSEIVLSLPLPRALERSVEISGSQARAVPIHRAGAADAPLADLARARVLGCLAPLMGALQRKVPEARLRIEFSEAR